MQLLQGDRPGPSTPRAESGAQDGLQFVHGFWDFLRYFTVTQHHTSVGQGSSMNHDAHPKTWGCGCNRYPGSKQTSRGKRLGRCALIHPDPRSEWCWILVLSVLFCESSENLTALSSSFFILTWDDRWWLNQPPSGRGNVPGRRFLDLKGGVQSPACLRARQQPWQTTFLHLFLPPRMGPPRQQVDVSPTSPQVALA